ncbi:pre-rRNA-processing protein TSR2 homolog [Diretmus argenteus]
MAASAAAREAFREAVRAVLGTWPVLQIAVDNGFGGVYGQQKADWLADVVQQYFYDNADLQQDEVEDYITDLMDQEFNTVVDDGSLPQLSSQLCQLFAQYQQGALEQLRQTVNTLTKKTDRAKVTAASTAADEEESEEEAEAMECSSSSPSASSASSLSASSASQTRPEHPPPSQDEDGWTVVRKKK